MRTLFIITTALMGIFSLNGMSRLSGSVGIFSISQLICSSLKRGFCTDLPDAFYKKHAIKLLSEMQKQTKKKSNGDLYEDSFKSFLQQRQELASHILFTRLIADLDTDTTRNMKAYEGIVLTTTPLRLAIDLSDSAEFKALSFIHGKYSRSVLSLLHSLVKKKEERLKRRTDGKKSLLEDDKISLIFLVSKCFSGVLLKELEKIESKG